jgi:hypothetical protein
MRVTTGSAPGCAESGPTGVDAVAHRVRESNAGVAGLQAHTPGACRRRGRAHAWSERW